MASFNDLTIDQTDLLGRIKNAYSNFIAQFKDEYTIANIDARLSLLEKNWLKYQTNHEKIMTMKTDSNKSHHYFEAPLQMLNKIEELYYDEQAKFMEEKAKLSVPDLNSSNISHSSRHTIHVRPSHRKMPAISLPKFSGKHTDWIEFRDLFKALVADSQYSEVERLSYLKESLSDEPHSLIKWLSLNKIFLLLGKIC